MGEIKNYTNAYKEIVTYYKSTKGKSDDLNRMESIPSGTVPSRIDLKNMLSIVLSDEEIRGFFGNIVDAIVRSGFKFKGKKSAISNAENVRKELRLNKRFKKIFWDGLTYNIVFIELIPNASKTKIVDLRIHDPGKIEPKINTRGIVEKYVRTEEDGTETFFSTDEMVCLKIEEIDYGFWTYPQIKTLSRLVKLKNLIMDHLLWLFDSNQFRTHLHFQGASPDDMKEITHSLKHSMLDKNKFLLTVGENDLDPKKLNDETTVLPLIELLNKTRNMMLTLIRVPPIIAGTVDNSNRSNSDVQAEFAFMNRINSFEQDLQDELEMFLFPKIGLSNVSISFNLMNLKQEKTLIEEAQALAGMGADKIMLLDWLNDKGMTLPVGLFDKAVKEADDMKQAQMDGVQQTDNVKLPPNSNQFPSRKSQDNFDNRIKG